MIVYVPLLATMITHFDYGFSPNNEGPRKENRMTTAYGCLYELFWSQKPRKSPPAVMPTSRETLCINCAHMTLTGCKPHLVGATAQSLVQDGCQLNSHPQ